MLNLTAEARSLSALRCFLNLGLPTAMSSPHPTAEGGEGYFSREITWKFRISSRSLRSNGSCGERRSRGSEPGSSLGSPGPPCARAPYTRGTADGISPGFIRPGRKLPWRPGHRVPPKLRIRASRKCTLCIRLVPVRLTRRADPSLDEGREQHRTPFDGAPCHTDPHRGSWSAAACSRSAG